MFLTKLKLTAALVLAIGAIAAGAAGVSSDFLVGQEPKNTLARAEAQAVAKPAGKPANRNEGLEDAERLQGEWQAIDGEKGGQPLREDPSDLRITFKGDEITFLEESKTKYRLDTGKSPRELHITFLDGKFKGQTLRTIYSLQNDELKLCMPLGPQSARPTEFKTAPGSNLVVLVLRRVPKGAAGLKQAADVAIVQRQWTRPDAAPDGNYTLSYLDEVTEETCCLIKLETKEEKQSVSLVDTERDDPVTAVRKEAPALPLFPAPAGRVTAKGVQIRLVCTTSRGDWTFEGSFSPPSLQARGHLEGNGVVLPAMLTATDLTKLKFTTRDLPVTPLREALRFGRAVEGLRQRAAFAKDPKEKADLAQQAANKEQAALLEAPKLLREGFDRPGEDPLAFEAAVDAARRATRYRISMEQLRTIIARADQTAATYGQGWQREFNLRIAAALAPQKDYAPLAQEIATRLEKELVPADAASIRQRILKTLATAQGHTGQSAAAKEALAGLLAKVEETLDREYRAKVPPFKPVSFAGRKAKSDRAVVLELFTGTQCPPCVAAGVAFDALHETYRPSELVLLQYHLHIPGSDPLANADSETRFAYYAKSFPKEALGVPTTFFNGKPEAGGGGPMARAEEKYKQYRRVIDPLLETSGTAKVSASALRQGDQISIQAAVTDLQQPGNVRLRLLLVEEMVRYAGPNRVRFHHHVVRSMIGGADGFALSDKNSKHTAVVDLEALRKSLSHYLDDYNDNWRSFPSLERPLDLADLRLIALVQNDTTREILQAAEIEIVVQRKNR